MMKALLSLVLMFPVFGYSQLSRFNFYEPATSPKADTVKNSLPLTSFSGYLDTGIIMWSIDTIHWIPSKGTLNGREITGYYFDMRTKSYLRK